MPRISASDLEILSKFVFGEHWQRPLSLAIHRSARQVRRWRALQRPISKDCARILVMLTRDKHGKQIRQLRARYLAMIDSLHDTATRARLLAMDLDQLRATDELRRVALEAAEIAEQAAAAAEAEAEAALVISAPRIPAPRPAVAAEIAVVD